MKKIFFIVTILQLSFSVFGQYYTSSNTFYVTPPVNGCDGVWAVNDSLITSGNCPPPYMLTVFPNGCATENHVSGDTLFFDLCSFPCSYQLVNFNSDTCLSCFVSTSTEPVPSSCNAADSIVDNYTDDAKRLALKYILAQNLPDADSINIPAELSSAILNALIAVYNATELPAIDTVITMFNIHTWPVPETKTILVSAEPYMEWMSQLQNNITPTGYSSLDSLLSKYYLHVAYYHTWSDLLSYHTVELESDSSYNISALVNAFDTISGVNFSEPKTHEGDGNDIYCEIGSGFVELVYSLGWGDCESGCIYRRNWTFHVFDDCSVAYLGSYGMPLVIDFNAEINTNNSFSIYPNPSNGEFTIKSNNSINSTIAIYNSMGIKIKTEHFKANSSELNITGLTAGVYFVVLESDGKRIGSKKVIVNK